MEAHSILGTSYFTKSLNHARKNSPKQKRLVLITYAFVLFVLLRISFMMGTVVKIEEEFNDLPVNERQSYIPSYIENYFLENAVKLGWDDELVSFDFYILPQTY